MYFERWCRYRSRIVFMVLSTFMVITFFGASALAVGSKLKEVGSVRICLPQSPSAIVRKTANILTSRIEEYSGAEVSRVGGAEFTVNLGVKEGIGKEGFRISSAPDGVNITGNDERGLLYGVGKFLHTSTYSENGMTPSSWRGVSVPEKPVRAIYFATHFNNWYHVAPVSDVQRYIEDLSLWGTNILMVDYAPFAYNGIDDPEAQAILSRLRIIFKAAREVGMDTCIVCTNEGYKNTPRELLADESTVNHEGYSDLNGKRIYNLGTEICPNKPGGIEAILKVNQERLDAFKEVGGIDYFMPWPYDNGGCTCRDCKPWGANGYLKMSELISRDYRKTYPKGKVILSTWYFDRWGIGEWSGISEKFAKNKPDWVDYILADDYGEKYPEYPIKHGSPGGVPMVNFPEITMYLHEPWGGFGANPQPEHFQEIWNYSKDILAGGFPYSEGIFEDMNKIIFAEFYWDSDKPATDTVKEYISFYFSPSVVDEVSRAVNIMERNIERRKENKDGVTRFIMKNTAGTDEAFRLISEADAKLPERVRKSWRWRFFYLRALIDNELVKHDFRVSDKCEAAFRELEQISYAKDAWPMIRPPYNNKGIVKTED